jgi:S-adenosylmethionine hydrolase
MGHKDYYVASIKGAVYSKIKDVQVVDISHEIKPFDIAHASYVLKNCYKDFPIGTIHIVGVNPEETTVYKHIVIQHEGHFFIGADNGLFSLVFIDTPEHIYEIDSSQFDNHTHSFPTKNVFVEVANKIVSNASIATIGPKKESLNRRQLFRPTVEPDVIKGTVSYIDAYGNIITNVDKTLFNEVCGERSFKIYLTRAGYTISKISNKYSEVPEGEKVAIFSNSGFLEIAINKGVDGSGGGANKLFGIKLNDTITIEFE